MTVNCRKWQSQRVRIFTTVVAGWQFKMLWKHFFTVSNRFRSQALQHLWKRLLKEVLTSSPTLFILMQQVRFTATLYSLYQLLTLLMLHCTPPLTRGSGPANVPGIPPPSYVVLMWRRILAHRVVRTILLGPTAAHTILHSERHRHRLYKQQNCHKNDKFFTSCVCQDHLILYNLRYWHPASEQPKQLARMFQLLLPPMEVSNGTSSSLPPLTGRDLYTYNEIMPAGR